MEHGVLMMEWYNSTTSEIVSVGPSAGIFLASFSNCKKVYAYDARIFYDAKKEIIRGRSSIQLQYDNLKEVYEARARSHEEPFQIPPFVQFYKHYHAFIQSQARAYAFLSLPSVCATSCARIPSVC